MCPPLHVACPSSEVQNERLEDQPRIGVGDYVDEDVDQDEDEPAPVAEAMEAPDSALVWGAKRLHDTFGALSLSHKLSEDVTYKTAMQRVHAAAETMACLQAEQFRELLTGVSQLVHAGVFRAVACVERVAYDETPLTLTVFFDEFGDKQHAKCWVVEVEWLLFLQQLEGEPPEAASSYLALRGAVTPQVRATMSATGESIRAVLRSCFQVPCQYLQECGLWIRICEADEAPANGRCESLILQERAEIGQRWCHLNSVCLAHKLHTSVQHSWNLMAETLTGIIHCSLHLSSAGNMKRLRDAVPALVEKELRIVEFAQLSSQELHYKDTVLNLCLPSREQPRKRGAVQTLACLLNSSWDECRPLTHHCSSSCCSSEEETLK